MLPETRQRPGDESSGALQVAGQAETSLSDTADLDSLDALADVVDGAHVVVVRTTDDRYRRRVYLSLAAADRAAERARGRGHDAAVVLCRLDPVRGWDE